MNQIKYIYLMLVSFAIILMLLPLLNSGFFGDDAANSFINGNLQYNDQNLAQGILNNIKIWLEMGRFFPINLVIINCIFAFANNLILYKSLIILSILANILLFAYFIRIITNSPSLGFLSMLVMPILFQFRNFHDPILGYSMLQQSLFLFIIISLIFFVFYMKSTKSRYLYISLFMYILSILTYEIALPFFLLYCLISYLCCAKKRLFFILKVCTPHFLVLLAYLLIIFVIQINLDIPTISDDTSPSRYSGIIPNLNIEDFIITFAKQNIAAFPLSYQISNHMFQASFNLNNIKELFSTPSIFIAIIYFVLSVIILNYINKEISEKNINELNVKCLLIMGLFILITPSIFVALSTKYQKELYWGVGYLPVYISYFGVTIIFICIIHHMLFRISLYNKNINIIFLVLIAVLISLTGALTYTSNEMVIENLNHDWLYPRLIIENGLDNGLLKFVPENSILIVDSSNPWWEQPGFYLMHSGIRLRSVESNGLQSKPYLSDELPNEAFISNCSGIYTLRFSKSDDVFYLRYGSQSRESGYAILGEIIDLIATNASLNIITASDVYVYIQKRDILISPNNTFVEGYWKKNESTSNYEPFRIKEDNLKLVSSGEEWKIFSIPGSNIIDIGSICIYSIHDHTSTGPFASSKKFKIKLLNGFWETEDWSGTPTRWMNAEANISVTAREDCKATLGFSAQSFYSNQTVEIFSSGEPPIRIAVPTSSINVSVPISLAEGVNTICLHVSEGCKRPSDKPELKNADSRCLSIAVQNITVT